MKLCYPLRLVCLFSLFSHEYKESLFIAFLEKKKKVSDDLSLLIKMSSSKQYSPSTNTTSLNFLKPPTHIQEHYTAGTFPSMPLGVKRSHTGALITTFKEAGCKNWQLVKFTVQ